jgi:hypothetical protein
MECPQEVRHFLGAFFIYLAGVITIFLNSIGP